MALLKDFEKIKCPVLVYLPENEESFLSRSSKFALHLETGNDIARSKILVARLCNVASKFLVCFEQSIKDFMVHIFYNATLLCHCGRCPILAKTELIFISGPMIPDMPGFGQCREKHLGRNPFNQNSDRSDQEKRTTAKGGPVFSKLFRLDRTNPLSFGPKFPEILVEWIAPLI